MKITAVVVTKGDRDISQVTDSLSNFDELIVWDNSKAIKDLKVFGRYAAAFIARNDLIYIQDDDCIIDTGKLLDKYESSMHHCYDVFSNFPQDRRMEYSGSKITLVGWGTLFHKNTMKVFCNYLEANPFDDLFLRECDRVFSYLNTVIHTDVGVTHLPYAFGLDRMGKEDNHHQDFNDIRRRLTIL